MNFVTENSQRHRKCLEIRMIRSRNGSARESKRKRNEYQYTTAQKPQHVMMEIQKLSKGENLKTTRKLDIRNALE